MITLKKDNIVMKVATELQASVFLRNGYKIVDDEPVKAQEEVKEPAEAKEDVKAEAPAETPKRRRRTKKAEADAKAE